MGALNRTGRPLGVASSARRQSLTIIQFKYRGGVGGGREKGRGEGGGGILK